MHALPASGPGSMKYAIYFSPRFGGNSDFGGGAIDGYYDLIRYGAEVFGDRHQVMEDTALWLMGGSVGPPPFDDPGSEPGPILGQVAAAIFGDAEASDPILDLRGTAALAVAVQVTATPAPPQGDIAMTALTDAAENTVLAWLLTTGAVTRPTQWHVQLHVGAPSEAGTANVAVNSARQPVSFGAPSGGALANSSAVSWPNAPANETVTHITVWSAAVGGTALIWGQLTTPRTVQPGDTFTIPANSLTITAD